MENQFSRNSINLSSDLHIRTIRCTQNKKIYLFFIVFFTVIKWNKFDLNKVNSEAFSVFEKRILKFERPSLNAIFSSHNSNGIKLIRVEP